MAKYQRDSSRHLNQSRIVLEDRVYNPWHCVPQASLGRCPWDMGAGWGSGYPEGSSSRQDSPLAKWAWPLAPGSARDRTCGRSRCVIRNEGGEASDIPRLSQFF